MRNSVLCSGPFAFGTALALHGLVAVFAYLLLTHRPSIGMETVITPAVVEAPEADNRPTLLSRPVSTNSQTKANRKLPPRYRSLVHERIARNLNAPGLGLPAGLTCVVTVRLAPDGRVLDAWITRHSGNERFDRSLITAAHKASPFPPPPPSKLERGAFELVLTFRT